LSPIELGRAAVVTTGIAFFALILVNPVGTLFNRRLHSWFCNGSAQTYTHLYGLYVLFLSIIATLIFVFLATAGFDLVGLSWPWILALVGGSLFCNTAVQTLIPSLNLLGRGVCFTVLNLSTLAMSLSLSIALCLYISSTAEYWLLGAMLSQMVFGGVAYAVLFKAYPSSPALLSLSTTKIMHSFQFCWPVALAVGLQWIYQQGYRFVLVDQFGLAEFGLFAAGYGLAIAVMAAGEIVLSTWFQPAFYKAANSAIEAERAVAWKTYAARMLPGSFLGVSLLIVASDLLPKVMLGPEFHDAGIYVLVGAFAEWGRFLVGVFGLNAHRLMATRQLILPNAFGAVVAVIGTLLSIYLLDASILLGPIFAAMGCGVAVGFLWKSALSNEGNNELKFGYLGLQALSLILVSFVLKLWVQSITHGYTDSLTIFVALGAIAVIWSTFAFFMYKNQLITRRD
jgi:hypothetical protein